MPAMPFSNLHVVVTGATGGLGGAVVQRLLAAGATCHLPMAEAAPPAHAPWRGHDRARPTPGVALADDAAVRAYYAALPAVDASIHLAGGFAMKPLLDTTLDDYHQQHSINALTCFLCCREAVRRMTAAGRGGRIVNVASRSALTAPAGQVAYVASKAEVCAITQVIAAETRDQGILVNAVLPSIIDTPANRAAMPTADHAAWPRPEQLAETIAFLASPANTLTSGALVPVYGRA
jgi:NAD(P)-dependent dehydrogenase (short-subunit alcohol dehydrogenase family)